MSAERDQSGGEGLGARADEAERRLQKASEAADAARKRTTAEIRSLEADLETERLRAQEELEKARAHHADELERLRASNQQEIEREREAKEQAITAAESRLADIESQAEAAERRVAEAERQASESAGAGGDADARAREGAAAWLRGQIEAIREEARGK